MTRHHHPCISRRSLLVTAAIAGAALTPAVAQAAPARTPARAQDPVARALGRIAHPLRATEPGGKHTDLRALGTMIGGAKVVGLGEATHGSHEFFTMKERLFRHLVREKGFRAFSLEFSWPAGLRINDYLQSGEGDARQIAAETLANSPWDREEFVHLIEWMRDHNRRNPTRTVHFVGNDLAGPAITDEFFGRITGYAHRHHPALAPRIDELYTGLRPVDDVFAYLDKPLAERKRFADRARQVLDLIAAAGGRDREAHIWAVQNARSVADTTKFLTADVYDPATMPAFQRFRDEVMARNILWWQRRTGHKVLVSAHNDHLGLIAATADMYPKTQGSFLRDALGRDYLPIAMTFDRGSFLSKSTAIGGDWKTFTVGAAAPGTNEHTLDRVRHRDFYADLRAAPPTARRWLETARPTRSIGTLFHDNYPLYDLALGRAFDALIHLHDVREAVPRRP
ncbi:erythromycin esterase family protein [Streptomyces qinzhouensis]|uniref:Erythromycin esterase family protein n=1 Tax=Streptomyces qinzhouensis TaxID=2599401 RepID=A0A5B8IGT4_9ACTN|nr:erythromycin esterase family protein [Streptomyces qinzhouensis]QDY76509.1 erythromycin esterase family protein [Streptomyces qinzhouensis]